MSAPPIPSAPADLELIAQLKSKLQYAELRIRVLEERLRLLQRMSKSVGREWYMRLVGLMREDSFSKQCS